MLAGLEGLSIADLKVDVEAGFKPSLAARLRGLQPLAIIARCCAFLLNHEASLSKHVLNAELAAVNIQLQYPELPVRLERPRSLPDRTRRLTRISVVSSPIRTMEINPKSHKPLRFVVFNSHNHSEYWHQRQYRFKIPLDFETRPPMIRTWF